MMIASSKKRRRAQSSPRPFPALVGRVPILAIRCRPLFLDLATSGFDRCLGTFGHCQTFDSHGAGQLTREKHFGALDVGADQTGLAQRSQIDDITLYRIQLAKTDLGTDHGDTGGEAELREALLERHLATLETRANTASGTRFLTLVAVAAGLAETTADTATEALAFFDPARGGTQCVEAHDHSPSTLTI